MSVTVLGRSFYGAQALVLATAFYLGGLLPFQKQLQGPPLIRPRRGKKREIGRSKTRVWKLSWKKKEEGALQVVEDPTFRGLVFGSIDADQSDSTFFGKCSLRSIRGTMLQILVSKFSKISLQILKCLALTTQI